MNFKEEWITKKWIALTVLLAVVLSGAILAGCGGDKDTGSQQSGQPSQSAKAESISDIFAKAEKVDGMSYDYTVTANDMTMNGKVWMQGKKMKTESTMGSENVISYFDGDTNTVIIYNPAQKTAMKMSAGEAEEQNAVSDTPIDYTSDIDETNVKELETVVYEGVKCRLVEVSEKESNTVTKMWIREDYGIPMRIESTDPTGEKFVMEYKNLKVGSIAADVFQLPAGVEVTDMSEMLNQLQQIPGMPGAQQ